MRSSEARRGLAALGFALASAVSAEAAAQQPAQGFALERLYTSAPGGGWFVMDSLDTRPGLGGAMAATTSYARAPLRITDGASRWAVISDQLTTNFAFALSYDRVRVYADVTMPLSSTGDSATVAAASYTAPSLTVPSTPDTLWDPRVGVDVRLLGQSGAPARLGVGAQLILPSGQRSDYGTDGTYRAQLRALFAGDEGAFTYAAQLGVHVRPLDDTGIPGSPRGSELLFGAALGYALGVAPATRLVIGPEVYGATALRDPLGGTTTALEGLVTGRYETTPREGPRVRVKLGAGPGLDATFGAPQWRVVLGLEVAGDVTR